MSPLTQEGPGAPFVLKSDGFRTQFRHSHSPNSCSPKTVLLLFVAMGQACSRAGASTMVTGASFGHSGVAWPLEIPNKPRTIINLRPSTPCLISTGRACVAGHANHSCAKLSQGFARHASAIHAPNSVRATGFSPCIPRHKC